MDRRKAYIRTALCYGFAVAVAAGFAHFSGEVAEMHFAEKERAETIQYAWQSAASDERLASKNLMTSEEFAARQRHLRDCVRAGDDFQAAISSDDLGAVRVQREIFRKTCNGGPKG